MSIGGERRTPIIVQAVSIAEGESLRTCQIRGCREVRRDVAGWWITICHGHYLAAAGASRGLDQIPGMDDRLRYWAFAVKPALKDSGQKGVEYCSLDGGVSAWIKDPYFLHGMLEPHSLVIALDPESVEALVGDVPAPIRSAEEVFRRMAAERGFSQEELSRRLELARTVCRKGGRDQISETAALADVWNWLGGIS